MAKNKIRLTIGVICVIGIALLAWSMVSTLAEQDYNALGLAAYDQGNYAKAIDCFNKAIESEPDNAKAYYNRGLAYFQQGGWGNTEPFEKAIRDYTKAIELDPKYVDAYYNRALAYEKFIHHYHKLPAESFPPETEAKYNKGLADLDKVLELDPNYVLAYAGKGNLYYRHGDSYEDMKKGIAKYNKALESENLIKEKVGKKGLAGVYYSRGRTYTHMGKWSKAESDYLKALELDPDCGKAVGHLIGLYQDWGKCKELIELINSESGQWYREKHLFVGIPIGSCYYKLGQYDKAKAELEAPSIYQGMHGALWGPQGKRCLAKIYRKEGDENSAKDVLEEAIEMSNKKIAKGGKTFTAYYQRGLTYLELKEYHKAISDLDKVIEAKAASDRKYGHTNYYIEAHIGLGKVYSEMSEKGKARQHFEKAIELLRRPGGPKPIIRDIQELLKQL